ncbi:MAG: porin family protein [bacterium]|nr:porin family protein [bacterium]MDY2830993.1 porin family protein [Alphaproteobacteria bacterium]
MKKTLLLVSVATSLFAINANAIEFKPYIGLDYAYSKASTDDVVVEGVAVPSEYYEDNFHSAIINAGAKLHKNFGLEAFYQKSTKEEGNLSTLVIGGVPIATDKIETSFNAYGLDLQGYLPIQENFELVGSLGIGQYKFKMKGFGYTAKDDDVGYRLGAGAQYNINENFALRGMVRYNIIDSDAVDDIKELSIGLRYNF